MYSVSPISSEILLFLKEQKPKLLTTILTQKAYFTRKCFKQGSLQLWFTPDQVKIYCLMRMELKSLEKQNKTGG